jgi:uncharacterized membrane protein
MALAGPREATSPTIVHNAKNERGIRVINIGETERLISIAIGIPVTIFGLTRGTLNQLLPTLLGGGLIFRGVTGHSFLYQALGVSRVEHSPAIAELPNNQGIQVKRAVTINASPEELYRYWRDFQNAPRFMENVESVQVTGDRRSHWVAKTPLGTRIAWDTEITNDEPGRFIAWRRTRGPFLAPNEWSVRFEPKRGGRETVVRLEIEFRQFRGPIGTMLGNILGQIAQQVVRKDLERFKELTEAGEIPTTKGQPSGRQR